ncbi:MAG: hypothetical protein HOM30_04585 [Gammaproteobacteria bacterium]|nr:hypothetical protein [Gammaproteobacteria bacterium]
MGKVTIQPLFSYINLLKSIISKNHIDHRLFKSGRHSLDYALREIISNNPRFKNILLPKLICNEIIPYIEKHKININYYNIEDNLNIDVKDLDNIVNDKPTIILVVNYFGFPADWRLINNLMERKDCLVIEDNAHSYPNDSIKNIKSDYSFDSYRKILPVLSGSMLKKKNHATLLANIAETRMPSRSEIIYSLRYIKNFFSNKSYKNKTVVESVDKNNKIDSISNAIIRGNSFNRLSIIKKRQQNYLFWRKYLNDKEVIFFDNLKLTKETCPYAFPCYAKNQSGIAYWKKWGVENNINIIAWPDFPLIIENDMQSSNLGRIILFPVNHQFDLNKRIG